MANKSPKPQRGQRVHAKRVATDPTFLVASTRGASAPVKGVECPVCRGGRHCPPDFHGREG